MSDKLIIEAVVLPSACYEPVQVIDMTIEQAREAINVLAQELLWFSTNATIRVS
jgi:hypothetical protein